MRRLTVATAIPLLATLLAPPALAAPDAPPRETIEGVDVVYGYVTSERGFRHRTITTRPRGAQGRLPAILLASWLSCDPVDNPKGPDPGDGMAILLRRLAKESGFVLLRVEKPGLGESEGPPCKDCDFETELAGYRAGLSSLVRDPGVDPARIFVLGMSNGGGYAPLVARDHPVRGYVSTGGWGRTWLEHMMSIERRLMELGGLAPGEVADRMKAVAELYTEYLVRKRLPGDVVKERPHLARVWDGPPAHQYGRPAAFYQQLQALNLPAAWEKVTVPVLVIAGEYDAYMAEDDQRPIADIVNARASGLATYVSVPGMTHFLNVHPDRASAFKGRNGRFHEPLVKVVIDWLREHSR